jgi:hypothetical protein
VIVMDNVIFPDPFRLDSRNPRGLSKNSQENAIKNFQMAVFESAKRAAGKLKIVRTAAGEKILRSVNYEFKDDAQRVPPRASRSTENRWSGAIPKTDIRRGALYTSLDLKGFVNEAMRHKRVGTTSKVRWEGSRSGFAEYTTYGPTSKDYKELLAGKVYRVFELKHSIDLADLSKAQAAKFYEQIENDRVYRTACNDLRVTQKLIPLVFDPVEYTSSRPVGLSVLLGHSGEGIRVVTAQAEASELKGSGYNLVLGGDDGEKISYLRPTGMLIAGTSSHQPALLEVDDVGGSHPSQGTVVPGSILDTKSDP